MKDSDKKRIEKGAKKFAERYGEVINRLANEDEPMPKETMTHERASFIFHTIKYMQSGDAIKWLQENVKEVK